VIETGLGKAPERLETDRLVLRRPRISDAETIFQRYASDREVTRYLGWPRHNAVAETSAFLGFSESEWEKWPAGPYLIESRTDARLIGGTGLGFETPHRASTGYVLAKDAWGKGYATEALLAVVGVARAVGVRRLYAHVHTEHRPSSRVLEKCGFLREGILRRYAEFPNLSPGDTSDVLCYSVIFEPGRS
jgi:[ribosomal protein S5]-alanine N-acetyltransferase